MLLGCTKKLLETIKVKPSPRSDVDPFFSWSASIATVNRRKLVTVMNDSTFCGFALYGLKAKDFKNLQDYVLQGIRSLFLAFQIEPSLIDRYMQDCGDTVTLTTTRNRSVVARLNHFTSHAEFWANEFVPDIPLQRHLLRRIGNDYVTLEGETWHTLQLLEDELMRHYRPEKLHQYRMIDLTINLHLERPSLCSRRVLLPQSLTLYDLHNVIQALFAWKDYHLHEFKVAPEMLLDEAFPEYASLREVAEYESVDCGKIEKVLFLKDVFDKYPDLHYLYDFGDSWEHDIHLNGFLDDADSGLPLCTLAVGDAPPEDVGGTLGYVDFLRIMADPLDEEYEDTKQWAEGTEWERLDMEELNRKLRRFR